MAQPSKSVEKAEDVYLQDGKGNATSVVDLEEPVQTPPSSPVKAPSAVELTPLPPTVRLASPGNLNAGYEFMARWEGRNIWVRVVGFFFVRVGSEQISWKNLTRPGALRSVHSKPYTGAKQGEWFTAHVIKEDGKAPRSSKSHQIPHGRWRDSVWNVCPNGMCHPMCCLAYFCTPVAIGQIMVRMKLDHLGRPLEKGQVSAAFKICFVLNVFIVAVGLGTTSVDGLFFVWTIFANFTSPLWTNAVNACQYGFFLVIYFFLFLVLMRTRAQIRRRYAIPELHCIGCEDVCCAFCNPWCAVLQMASHTADYKKHEALCCSQTGLTEESAELVV